MVVKKTDSVKLGSNIFTAADIEKRIHQGFDESCWVGQMVKIDNTMHTIASVRLVKKMNGEDTCIQVYITTNTQAEYMLESL
jgi:hypothetical protein